MRKTVFTLMLLGSMSLKAQNQQEIGQALFDHLREGAHVLNEQGIITDKRELKKYVKDFSSENGEGNYQKNFNIEVNQLMDFEIGKIQAGDDTYPVMFIKRKDDPSGPKVEFLVIFQESSPTDESVNPDKRRMKWMELCNAHQATSLVEELYTANAYYYNRGRLLQGTKAISTEYSYMNSPSYSLRLTPRHVVFVTPNIAYEIGQCSGTYNLPYMLLWKKQANGDWQILMDSNY